MASPKESVKNVRNVGREIEPRKAFVSTWRYREEQPPSQGLSSSRPGSERRETLVLAGHVSSRF